MYFIKLSMPRAEIGCGDPVAYPSYNIETSSVYQKLFIAE